jgi:very-short-patch-repair endonuclease
MQFGFETLRVPLPKGECQPFRIEQYTLKGVHTEKKHYWQREKTQGRFLDLFEIGIMYWLPYNKNLKTFSRKLRNHSTLGEVLLWKQLRAGQMMGYTFARQKPLDRFIVDFCCEPLRLVIEVDGGYHFNPSQMIRDKKRQGILESMGLNFLRFLDDEVRKDMPRVVSTIRNYILLQEERSGCRPSHRYPQCR